MSSILQDLRLSDLREVCPPQNWTSRAIDEIERLTQAQEDERERCAKACEGERLLGEALDPIDEAYNMAIRHSAAAIRALNNE